eukprot:gnl/TRDRNA2_/TRDRNA2_117422_c0_seq1.p1 gnl/TRDRNA2_/TRDRNA2_117422_c0~~gnl/TRDRNA2_/TRDRNA2_117422_c0_seq1.p1  ORF type:complete len:201 (-),score=17.63 gnl/TRDRNA2_/TRDRNA2_117422_c0_seq1:49-615(-)
MPVVARGGGRPQEVFVVVGSPTCVKFDSSALSQNSGSLRSATIHSDSGRSQRRASSSSFPARVSGPPIGPPFEESSPLLLDCANGHMHDLVSSFNFKVLGCCPWHSAVSRLLEECAKLKSLHTCTDKWAPEGVSWQCPNCSALHFEDNITDLCWVCGVPGAESEYDSEQIKGDDEELADTPLAAKKLL